MSDQSMTKSELIERIVPDLALRGIAIATVAALQGATRVDEMA